MQLDARSLPCWILAAAGLFAACDRAAPPAQVSTPRVEEAKAPDPPPASPALAVEFESLTGADPAAARDNFEHRLELPSSRFVEPIRRGAVVLITREAVLYEGAVVAAIEGGRVSPRDVDRHNIPRLGEALAAVAGGGPQQTRHGIVFADRTVAFDVVLDVFYTGLRAGLFSFQIAVRPDGWSDRSRSLALTLAPTTSEFERDAGGFDSLLGLEIGADAVRVGQFHRGPEPFTYAETWHRSLPWPASASTDELVGLAREVAAKIQGPGRDGPVVLTIVMPGTPVGSVVAARDAVAGPECDVGAVADGDRGRCLFLGWIYRGGAEPRPDSAAPAETRDRDTIRTTVRRNSGDVRDCYNRGLARDPQLRGRVVVEFTIALSGVVQSAKITESDLADAAVGTCIAEAARGWKFPQLREASVVQYPFVLEPS